MAESSLQTRRRRRKKRLLDLPRVFFVCCGCCNKIIHAHIQAKKQNQQIKQLVHMDEMLDMDETLTYVMSITILKAFISCKDILNS
jgi:hypothetical protein